MKSKSIINKILVITSLALCMGMVGVLAYNRYSPEIATFAYEVEGFIDRMNDYEAWNSIKDYNTLLAECENVISSGDKRYLEELKGKLDDFEEKLIIENKETVYDKIQKLKQDNVDKYTINELERLMNSNRYKDANHLAFVVMSNKKNRNIESNKSFLQQHTDLLNKTWNSNKGDSFKIVSEREIKISDSDKIRIINPILWEIADTEGCVTAICLDDTDNLNKIYLEITDNKDLKINGKIYTSN